MYDVPSEMVFPYAYNDGGSHVFIHYSAFLLFMSRLLGDSGVRTEDPAEANLFYVPSFTYYLHSNLGDPSAHLLRIVRYIKAQYPWFSRHQGKDHFVWLTSDRGACYLRDLPELQNMIKVVHFGLSEPNIKWMKGVHNMEVGCFLESRDVVAAGVLADKEVAHAAVVYEHMHKGVSQVVGTQDHSLLLQRGCQARPAGLQRWCQAGAVQGDCGAQQDGGPA